MAGRRATSLSSPTRAISFSICTSSASAMPGSSALVLNQIPGVVENGLSATSATGRSPAMATAGGGGARHQRGHFPRRRRVAVEPTVEHLHRSGEVVWAFDYDLFDRRRLGRRPCGPLTRRQPARKSRSPRKAGRGHLRDPGAACRKSSWSYARNTANWPARRATTAGPMARGASTAGVPAPAPGGTRPSRKGLTGGCSTARGWRCSIPARVSSIRMCVELADGEAEDGQAHTVATGGHPVRARHEKRRNSPPASSSNDTS